MQNLSLYTSYTSFLIERFSNTKRIMHARNVFVGMLDGTHHGYDTVGFLSSIILLYNGLAGIEVCLNSQ